MPVHSYRLRVCFSLVSLALAAQTPQGYQSEDEYNLVRSIRAESVAGKQLEMLSRWRQQYPRSAFRQERFQMIIDAQQRLGQGDKMLQTAYAMAADDPKGLGSFWVATLVVSQRERWPRPLRAAEKAAKTLLANAATLYSKQRRPEAVDPRAWEEQRVKSEAVAHRALGWSAMCQSKWHDAETEFQQVLLRDRYDAEASYWMGVSILSQGSDREAIAFYHLARSLALNGPGELAADEKRKARDYFEAAYTRSHGSLRGVERLYAEAARGGPLPGNR